MDDAEYDELTSSLTPNEAVDGVTTYRNTVSIACPACGDPFDDLVVCEGEYSSLELSRMLDLCVSTHEENVVLFTHKQ
jgi:hypothetical protein